MIHLFLAAVEVLTFNIRYDNPSDGVNSWGLRKSTIASYLIQSRADFIGLQEVLPSQMADLKDSLMDYGVVSRTREALPGKGESVPLWFHRERWRLDESQHGTFWLSSHPEKAGSKSWDSSLPRICTWGRFERIGKGEPEAVWVMNTHFDHRGATARLNSARLIRQKIEQRPKSMNLEPVIVLGDLNTLPASDPILTLGMADALGNSTSGTWNGWKPENRKDQRIDYILSRGLESISSKVDFLETQEGRAASDHWPVRAVLRTPRQPF